MKGLKGLRLGLIAAAAVVFTMGAGLVASPQVSAQDEEISIGSATAAPGNQASVNLLARNMSAPGLGAWTVDVEYDPTVVTAVSCGPEHGGVCNTAFDTDTVRVTGASAAGVEGDNTLVSITFRCDTEGSTLLALTVQLLVDATPGDPQSIDADIVNGSITCTTAPPSPTSPPPTGCLDDSFENDDTSETATAVSLPFTTAGLRSCPADDDWFVFALSAGDLVQIDAVFVNANGDIDIMLFDPAGHVVGSSASATDNEHINYTAETSGNFSLVVFLFEDALTVGNDYSLQIMGPAGGTIVLPGVGAGSAGWGGGSALNWFIAALAGAGLVSLVGFGALRLRARRL